MSNYEEIRQLYEIIEDFEHPLHFEACDDLGRLINDLVEIELVQETSLRPEVINMATNIYADGCYAEMANQNLYPELAVNVLEHLDQMRDTENFDDLIQIYAEIDPGYAIAYLASEQLENVTVNEFVDNESVSLKTLNEALESALIAGRTSHTASDVKVQQNEILSSMNTAAEDESYWLNISYIDNQSIELIREALLLPHNYLNEKYKIVAWQSILSEYVAHKLDM